MKKNSSLTALQVMQDAPVLPLIGLHDVTQAVPLARALLAGGIRMLEITLRTPQALGQACRDLRLPLLPGVATASEIMLAQQGGFTELKLFPALQAGGVAMLKVWSGPFFDVKFCPTGGINAQNASDFLALPNVVCVGKANSMCCPANSRTSYRLMAC